MKFVTFHFILIGLVQAGAHNELKEITTDIQKAINKRSIITLDNGLKDWKPSMPELVKRYDTRGMKAESVDSVNGRMPRSESFFPVSESQRKPPLAVSKRNNHQSAEIQIHQLRKRSKKIKIKLSSKTKTKSVEKKTVYKFSNKPHTTYEVKTKTVIKTKKDKSLSKKISKILKKLTKKNKHSEKTTYKIKTTIKHK